MPDQNALPSTPYVTMEVLEPHTIFSINGELNCGQATTREQKYGRGAVLGDFFTLWRGQTSKLVPQTYRKL